MNIEKRVSAFVELGLCLKNLPSEDKDNLYLKARNNNSWFTDQNIEEAIQGISLFLDSETLTNWVNQYHLPQRPKIVGTIMAGNIPLVGFHDLLCILISGHQLMVKMSSQDSVLMEFIINKLTAINSGFKERIQMVDQLKGMDAIIATGSDNTARYFEYYFGKYPNIIRKNRSSCAIISGSESNAELGNLGQDIFSYFGLGCRNVSKLFVPTNYNFNAFFESIEFCSHVKEHHKYNNNYDNNKSIYIVNGEKHLDNGFLLVTESPQSVSPISVLFYEEYTNDIELKEKIALAQAKIQCIVSKNGDYPNSFSFGEAQSPKIDDYADHVDTMRFLCQL